MCFRASFGCLAVVSLLVVQSSLLSAADDPRPNVLFIISDDLRCELGCYGNQQAKSPNLDRLAKRGVVFDRAYVQYTVCNPSRISFLTGLRPQTTGIFDNSAYFRERLPDVVTLPQAFREQGYHTVSLGKVYHTGLVFDQYDSRMDDPKSWDESRVFLPTETGLKGETRNMTGGALSWCYWRAAEGDDDDQQDGKVAARAVELLKEKRDKPLFLAVGFQKPHDPFVAPKKYFDLYPLDQLKLPTLPEQPKNDPPLAVSKSWGKFKFSDFSDRDKREFLRAYYAGLSFMDAQVGRLLDTLDEHELWQNTVIVFIGDHGYHLGERDWWNKNTLFEISTRTPLLVWSPKMGGSGQHAAGLVEFIDIFPTLTELCRVTPPQGLEGRSFAELLVHPDQPGKPAAYTVIRRGKVEGRTVRTDRYRYTEWDGGKQGRELYDHETDPHEVRNLADRPEHAETVTGLAQLLATP